MFIHFSNTELDHLAIQSVDRRERSSAYLEEREQVWNSQMEKVLAHNGQMWNGEVYTIEDFLFPIEEQIVLRVSTCEYKDVVFRSLKGQEYITSRYGESHLIRFAGVNCVLVTMDGKFVFGIRADQKVGGVPPIGGIGGTLNKDEMEIHSFGDIRKCILREIQEETAQDIPEERLVFFALCAMNHLYSFWFTTQLPVHSGEIHRFHRDGEFSSLVAITQQEAQHNYQCMTGGFRRLRPYLHLFESLLQG